MKTVNSAQAGLNYIDLINHFWKLNAEHPFTANEIAMRDCEKQSSEVGRGLYFEFAGRI